MLILFHIYLVWRSRLRQLRANWKLWKTRQQQFQKYQLILFLLWVALPLDHLLNHIQVEVGSNHPEVALGLTEAAVATEIVENNFVNIKRLLLEFFIWKICNCHLILLLEIESISFNTHNFSINFLCDLGNAQILN